MGGSGRTKRGGAGQRWPGRDASQGKKSEPLDGEPKPADGAPEPPDGAPEPADGTLWSSPTEHQRELERRLPARLCAPAPCWPPRLLRAGRARAGRSRAELGGVGRAGRVVSTLRWHSKLPARIVLLRALQKCSWASAVLTHFASILKTTAEKIRLIYSADGGVN